MPLKSLNLGRVCPMLLAFICTASGLYIFRDVPPEVQEGSGVRAAGIFRSAVLVLLWRIRVYPRSLKKLGRYMQYLIEFLLAMFIIEYLQADFWVPLEAAIKKSQGKVVELIDGAAQSLNMDISEYSEYLSNEWAAVFVAYGVSVFFLISVLHATKIIDLREMKYGPEPFLYAIMHAYGTLQQLLQGYRSLPPAGNRVTGCNKQRIQYSRADRIRKDEQDRRSLALLKKELEWNKKNRQKMYDLKVLDRRSQRDGDQPFDEDCSDFEMDCN